MASAAVIGDKIEAKTVDSRPLATPRFEWAMVALLTWLMTGAYTDAWYHAHFLKLDTILTPWHGLLYTGMLAITLFLGITQIRNQRRGYAIFSALPRGYGIAFLGCILFAIAGVIDLIGHLLYGIEFNLAALLSPTHLVLMLAASLIVTGPLRSAWSRPGVDPGYPAILSATYLLLMFTFFSQFDQPFLNDWAAGRRAPQLAPPLYTPVDLIEQLGLLGILLYTSSVTGLVLVLLRRFRLPLGTMTILLGLDAAALAPVRDHYWMAVVGIAGGLVADLLLAGLHPAVDRPLKLRTFAVAIPVIVAGLYFAVVWAVAGSWFPARISLGAVFASGITGLLLSYVLVAPRPEPVTP